MKKILYSVLGLGCLLATSCNMDLEPVGTIPDTEAIRDANDCFSFRNGFYNRLRSLSTGGYISYTEIQMDNFIGLISNGNVLGPINNGIILSGDSDIESIWGGLYSGVADVNFFFEKAEAIINDLADNPESVQDVQDIKRYIAESHFMRAYFYYWLLDHFCPAYTNANKGEKVGLPIVTVYNPTAKKDGYPDRSTLDETYKFIEDELELAYNGLLEWESLENVEVDGETINHKEAVTPMSPYLCTWTVRALQARLALLKGDNKAAAKYAKDVIDSGVYKLATRVDYKSMWTNDQSKEIIFRPLSTTSELGIASTGGAWISSNDYGASYIPVPYVALQGPTGLYEDGDVRYTTFIGSRNLQVEGALVKAPVFIKYPGNPSLNTVSGTNSLLNMAKPFRLSEMYLILAEASMEDGDETTANDCLRTLSKNRYASTHVYTDQSGEALRTLVRKERLRELIGEGFRMSDLRRWQQGFNRSDVNYTNYAGAGEVTTVAGRTVVYQDDDYRYTWPIPSAEIQVNPHLAGQQNRGYN